MPKNRIILDKLTKKEKQVEIEAKENEKLTYVLLDTGQGGKKSISFKINGQGSQVQILGIIIAKQGERTLHTLQHHLKPDTTSDLLVKSVLFNQSKLNYRGLIKIDQQAQRSNAYQRDENLLMSDGAKVDTRPELEIEANDVRCTHGATIGKIDEELLFYLMSRGITPRQAERLVITGFLDGVINRIPDKQVVRKVWRKVKDSLDKVML